MDEELCYLEVPILRGDHEKAIAVVVDLVQVERFLKTKVGPDRVCEGCVASRRKSQSLPVR